ncbi:uncharacterized protein HMPREF1541_02625 [Cyphellophora europaea CBS 101466]|uniref:O-methyltransferase domain-containing protein n=1 Tax=Cyphellophora europaea (strain CBS 101466) TaxID=1220924 RepID=W2S446_CYPE1|nr:uncharacterized protein HMPREF1541_02625 [Cyphellophora europaea CBS 101466]ETN43466.1 hypothetical protein HMPREF1541_02625 [Cyphellophora europaea CBS 101466]
MSPTDFHLQATLDLQRLASCQWPLNFCISDHVPLEGSISYDEVAKLADVPESQLMRLARLAMASGLFHEPIAGQIAHTPVSAGLISNSPLYDNMLFLTEANLPIASKIVEVTRAA